MAQDKPHDSLFRFSWSDLPTARAHFQGALSARLSEQLDWSTLALQPGSFMDERFQDFHSDVLYQVQTLDKKPVFLYLLFEHQSSMDRFMGLRVLTYLTRIWDQHLSQFPKTRQLPPIVSLVLYQGRERWTAPMQFQELVELPPTLQADLEAHLPKFCYVLEDLSAIPDEDLQGTALGKMTLLLFKHSEDGDLWLRFASWLDTVRQILSDQSTGLRAVEALYRYILSVAATAPPPEVRVALQQHLGSQTEAHLVSYAEQLRTEGRVEEARTFILQLLKARFPKANWSDVGQQLIGIPTDLLSQIHLDAAVATSSRQFRALLAQRLGGSGGA
jgi:hypothetical protein